MVVHMHNDLANHVLGHTDARKLLALAFGEDQTVQGAGRDGRLQYVPSSGSYQNSASAEQ